MVNNILSSTGHEVVACDASSQAMRAAEALGAETASTPAAVASSQGALHTAAIPLADFLLAAKLLGGPVKVRHGLLIADARVVITMLPSSSAVRDAYLGRNGLIQASRGLQPSLFIDCSTVSPATSQEIATEVQKCALHHEARPFPGCSAAHPAFLDAPASGELTAATAATLTFMVHTCLKSVILTHTILSPRHRCYDHTVQPGCGRRSSIGRGGAKGGQADIKSLSLT